MNPIDSLFSRPKSSARRPEVAARLAPPPPLLFSEHSDPAVPNSGWCCNDFSLGAGMVIFQPSTLKIVVVEDTVQKRWFLPRGRKDRGESLEQAALREAYEESGYQVEFLPLYSPTNAPVPPNDREDSEYVQPNTEPIFITTIVWGPRRNRKGELYDSGGEYLVSWYVGQIPENAVRHEGTGMPDEQNYVSHLLSPEEVVKKLPAQEARVVKYACAVYSEHLKVLAWLREEQELKAAPKTAEEKTQETAPVT